MTTSQNIPQGETVIIPNSKLCNEKLIRIRKDTPVGQVIDIGLDYSVPPHRSDAIVRSVEKAQNDLGWPRTLCQIRSFRRLLDSLQIYIWQQHSHEIALLRSEVLEQLWYTINRDGQTIPFPVTEVFIKEKADRSQLAINSHNESLRLVKELEYFRQFDTSMLEKLIEESNIHNYGPGETVIEEGQDGDSLYVLIEGCLKAFKSDQHTNGEILLSTLEPVAIIGEMAFHTGQRRSATIRCVDASSLLEIKRSTMYKLIQADPSLLEKIGLLISERQNQLRETEQSTPIKQNLVIAMMREIFLKPEDD